MNSHRACLDGFRWLLRLGFGLAFAIPIASAEECSLTAGFEEWRPYQFTDPEGRASGMDVDVLRAVAERAGCRLKFVHAQPKRLTHDLKNGDIDISYAYFTEEATEIGHFAQAFRFDTKALYVREGLDGRVRDLESFLRAGYRLGNVRGVYYGEDIIRLMADPAFDGQVEPTVTSKQNLKKLLAGRLDGAIINPPFVVDFMRTHNLAGDVENRSLIRQVPLHMAFSKVSVKEETVRAFDRAIEALKQDGTIDGIIAKYSE